jgi:hypothetical protein
MDYEGIKSLVRKADERFPRLRHLWLEAGYRGEGKGAHWVEKTLGWSVDLLERPRESPPPKGCSDEVGCGVGQRGRGRRLADTVAP